MVVVLDAVVATGGNLSSALPSTVAGLGLLKPVVESVRLGSAELSPKSSKRLSILLNVPLPYENFLPFCFGLAL